MPWSVTWVLDWWIPDDAQPVRAMTNPAMMNLVDAGTGNSEL